MTYRWERSWDVRGGWFIGPVHCWVYDVFPGWLRYYA